MKYKSLIFKGLKALAGAVFVFLIIAPSALLAQSATINIYVDLDNYAGETTWTLTGPSGPVASGGPYGAAADIINNDYVVTESGTYTFTINDTFGDGMSYDGANNENGTASYKITNDGTVEYQSANLPNFGSQSIHNFTVTVSGGGGSNLIGHWTFDSDGSDSSTNSFDGTLSGNAAINNTTYKVGTGSIALDGVNDYLELSTYSATLGTLSQGTIAAWIKTSEVINPQTIFGVADMSPPANGFGTFGLYEGKLMCDIMEGTYQLSATSNAVVADGSWHHVAVTVDGTGNHLYIDGNQLSASEKTYLFGTNSSTTAFFSSVNFVDAVQIGVTGENGSYAYDFNGLIDDVQVYNYALSALDISALANPTTSDATIGNYVWNDTNQDGIQNAGETGIQGVTVMLYTKTGVETAKAETDINGEYVITGITPGDYYLKFYPPNGYNLSPQNQGGNDALDSDANVTTGLAIGTTLTAGENDNTWDAGMYVPAATTAEIGNFVWNDTDQDGIQDAGETGLNNVTVRLYNSIGTLIDTDITDPSGFYLFENVTPGNYYLDFILPSGYSFSPQNATSDALDSDANSSTGLTASTTLSAGENDDTWDAGMYATSITHPNCDYLYAVADAGDILVYMPRDGSAGATTIGNNNASLIEATALSLDAQTLYASNANQLGVLDWNTGNFTARASTFGTGGGEEGEVAFTDVDGLAFDPLSGILYGTHRWTDGSPEDLLIQINPATGAHVPNAFGSGIDYVVIDTFDEVSLYDIDDIAISPVDGQMYGVINSSGGNDRIARINKYTGDVDDVGRSHTSTADVNDVEGLAFHNSGTFYGVTGATSTMYEIDVTNALFTLVHTMDNSGDYESVAGLTCGSNLITGNVFIDIDQDGINDIGESGQQNVTVKLYRDVNNDGLVDGGDIFAHSISTDSNGDYEFEVGTDGAFVLEIDQTTLPAGAVMSTDNKEEADFVNWGNVDPNNDFGFYIPPATASIGDFVWNDADQDGIQDAGELGLGNVTVNLYRGGGGFEAITTTDVNGNYEFLDLTPGGFYLEFVLPGGYVFSPQDVSTDLTDSDANTVTGLTTTTTLVGGENDITWDAGMYYAGTCPDNLLSNPGFELGNADWNWSGKATSVTDSYVGAKAGQVKGGASSNITQIITAQVGYTYSMSVWAKKTLINYADVGFYFLDASYTELQDVPAEVTSIGTYQQYNVQAIAPANTAYVQAYAWPGTNEANELTVDEYCLTEEAPALGTIGDFVWNDENADGVQDAGEPGMDNVTVELYLDNNHDGIIDGGDTHIGQATTSGGGLYDFTGVPAGDYLVTVSDDNNVLTNYNLTGGTDPHDVTLSAGQDYNSADFGYYDYDPTGYIYDEATGEIVSGGLIEVTGPGTVTIVHDGSSGYYEFYTDGTAGTYTIELTVPPGYLISTDCLPSDPPAFDPTGGPSPTVLGSGEAGSTGYLEDYTCGNNTFYYTFDLAPADPEIQHNNFPVKVIVAESCPDNLLSNPGFESDYTDWELWSAETITGDAYSGVKAAEISIDGFIQKVPGTPGTDYTLTAWAKIDITWGTIGIAFYDSDDNWLYEETVTVNGTSYSMYTVNATAPANTAFASAWVNSYSGGAMKADEFCLTEEAPSGSIGDYVWDDTNSDGEQNDGGATAGIEAVTLSLFDGTNTKIAETYTDANGWYEFTGLAPDDYTIILDHTTLPGDMEHPTYDYDGVDSQHFAYVTLTSGETNIQLDFGYSDTPLPVTLTSFKAEKVLNGVKLIWITESEIENQGFIIERRVVDANDSWNEIASFLTDTELKGQGTVTYSTNYEFIDQLIIPGNTYEYRLGDVDYNSVITYHATETVTIELSDIFGTPEMFSVKPAYPNPFNPSTVIEYGLPESGQVSVSIYDILGHSIKTLVNKNQSAGWHSISWYGTDNNGALVPAGMYFGIIISENSKHTIKLMYIK